MTDSSYALGYTCVAISILFFGSNFVVTKKFPTGDGMFFQWTMGTGILIVGIIAELVNGSPPFIPFAMLGGMLWAMGNALVVPTIKCIGMGMGLLIWGGTNMVVGWATGRFGLFGTNPADLSSQGLNTAGVVLAVVSLVIFFFVEPEDGSPRAKGRQQAANAAQAPLLTAAGLEGPPASLNSASFSYDSSATASLQPSSGSGGGGGGGSAGEEEDQQASWVDFLLPWQRRLVGVGLSVVSGLFYGCNFTPPSYCQNNAYNIAHPAEAPPGWVKPPHFEALCTSHAPLLLKDYAFSHFLGIWLTCTTILLLYGAWSFNKPRVFAVTLLPGILSGAMWAIAQYSWFISNAILSLAVAFPLTSLGPGFVGAVWGIFVFGEVKGINNFLILGAAFVFAVGAAVCIALSET